MCEYSTTNHVFNSVSALKPLRGGYPPRVPVAEEYYYYYYYYYQYYYMTPHDIDVGVGFDMRRVSA